MLKYKKMKSIFYKQGFLKIKINIAEKFIVVFLADSVLLRKNVNKRFFYVSALINIPPLLIFFFCIVSKVCHTAKKITQM